VIGFDNRLQVVERNAAAVDKLSTAGAQYHDGDLQDLFPELVGVQNQLMQIVEKQAGDYRLDHVNRRDGQGQPRYWDLLLLAGPEVGRGMLIIEEITEKAMVIQAVNQQRYDLYLYRQSLDHRRNQIGSWLKGQSTAIKRIIDTIQKISRIPSATVLLTGETGTGKNLTVCMIHESSMSSEMPFVEINCAARPESMI